jgi:hypothetical protein
MATHEFGVERKTGNDGGGGLSEQPADGGAGGAGPDVDDNQSGPGAAAGDDGGDESAARGGGSEGEAAKPAGGKPKKLTAAQKRKRARDYQRERNARQSAAGPGSKSGSSAKSGPSASATEATLDLTKILFTLHQMGAFWFEMPSLILEDEETKNLAEAITRVSQLYDVPMLDEKTRAWLNLGMVGANVYGTRVIAEILRRRRENTPAPPPMVLTPFPKQQHQPGPQQPPVVEGNLNDREVNNG